MDAVGAKVYDAMLYGNVLSTAQVNLIANNQSGANNAITGINFAIPCSLGCIASNISDNTTFQIAAKYTIGPWKLFGGVERVSFNNPDNPLNAGAFSNGGYNAAFVNDNRYVTTRVEYIFWTGVRYSVTRDWDVTGAYYGYHQNSFATSGQTTTQFVNVAGQWQ